MNRNVMLALLSESARPWDVLVIGGGATGLGIAVDAASRGFRTALLEQHDFAKGTSSRSTKLIHGGLRYLKQGNLRLVRESLRERGLLLRNAPHLVSPLPFLIPCYRTGESAFYGLGLKMYDALAGRLAIQGAKHLTALEATAELPELRQDGLRAGVLYWDGQFDDAALALCLARTAVDLGATVVNYFPVVRLLKNAGRICGVVGRDAESGNEYEVRARAVVNATGIFADRVCQLDEAITPVTMSPSRGAHIVLDKKFLSGRTALMIPKTTDKRVLFAIPWHGRVLVGTTDTAVNEVGLEPAPAVEEINFLLEQVGAYLTQAPRREDILSQFAGLRPLVRSAHGAKSALIPRDHSISVSPSGLLTITGGKWTTYRKMAEDAVDRLVKMGAVPERACVTDSLHLHGWTASNAPAREDGLRPYGSDAQPMLELADGKPGLLEQIHPALPYRALEIVWEIRNGMAVHLEDILARRTRALFLDARAAMECAPRVASIMSNELGQGKDWEEKEIKAFAEVAKKYLG
ncbi:MAG TPA: glycerol-3-phosphate dehydrogenase/oxidase [Verrucomicrobiae bacterium]